MSARREITAALGLMSPEAAADEAEKLLVGGFRSVKLRLGYPALEQDLAVTRAVRKRLPDTIELPVDYNQALTVAEAIRRGRVLQSEGIAWLEEPIRHDDYAGNAAIARELSVPVQIGENFNGPEAMLEALSAGACDYVMPDVARIGGVSGWIQAAGLAAARRIEMSSHLVPEISVHLLAATPTALYGQRSDGSEFPVDIMLSPIDGPEGKAVLAVVRDLTERLEADRQRQLAARNERRCCARSITASKTSCRSS